MSDACGDVWCPCARGGECVVSRYMHRDSRGEWRLNAPELQMQSDCSNLRSTGMSDWQTKATWMREVHASAAQWSESGQLIALTLGPEPASADADEDPAKQPTADERERRERAEHRRVALASSGGPRRRLSAHTD